MREHTWVSMAVAVICAGAGLVVLQWWVAEDLRVVRDWDFSRLPRAEWEWAFPGADTAAAPNGAVYTVGATGPGPRMSRVAIPAELISEVRVKIELEDASLSEPAEGIFEFYWARSEDIAAAGGGWPFSTDRGLRFVIFDRHRPNEYTVRVHRHPAWNGIIEDMFIGVRLPDDASDAYRLHTASITFLE